MISHWPWIEIPVFLIIAGYVYRRIGEARDDIRFPAPGEMIDIGGRKLHLIRKGSGGPTVVFESGAGGSSSMWWPFQDRLQDMTTVAYDRAGLGWSDAAALPRTMEERAADLHALLVAAKIPPPYVLVGISYGGPLIRLFARDHRNEVAGMVFVDIGHEAVFSTPGVQWYVNRMVTILRIMGGAAQIGLLRALGFRGIPEPPTALTLTPDQRQAIGSRASRPRGFFVMAEEFTSVKRIAAAMSGLGTPGLLGDVPIAVLSHGIPFPGSYAVLDINHMEGQKQLAALSTNSALIVAEKSSHVITWDEPEVVLDAIRRVVAAARDNSRLAKKAA
jgi:pimeloyl-ACP methyl ester carboxylesterase